MPLDNIDINKHHTFNTKTVYSNLIYSDEGIFYIVSDKIYKLNINDVLIEDSIFSDVDDKKYKVNIDKCTISKARKYSQIPYKHIIVQEELIYIKINPHSLVSLVIQKTNGIFTDWFIETKEDIDNYSTKQDISTLLSEIYLY